MDFGESFCAHKMCTVKLRQTNSTVFVITLLACLMAMFVTTPVLAQSPGYTDFSSPANLTTVGNAKVPVVNVNKQNVLRLTPDQMSQVGAAWFNIKQPVANGFTTTFTFQLSHAGFPADGIAFVIQNAPVSNELSPGGLSAIGLGGGGIGYDTIPNSLAVEFDTYANGEFNDPNANHVAVQSCGTGPNSVTHSSGEFIAPCQLGINSSFVLPNEGFLSDGSQHTATISYTPPNCADCSGILNVVLDGVNLFVEGVSVNLATLLSLNNGTAYVGFTGGTGAASENNDIVSWNFAPTTITKPAPAGQFTIFNFGTYLYKVRPNQNIDALSVTQVLIAPHSPEDPQSFNPGPNFPGADCIVYSGTAGKCVEFHVTCNSPSNNACSGVNYDVVTSYDVPSSESNITGAGFLKATNQDCPPAVPFDQNIITAFSQIRIDPTTKGSSKPTFSCFAAVQNVMYSPADIDIANLASPRVVTGSNLTYLIPVANFGPNAAQGVTITDTLPAGTTYVSSGLCSLTSGCSVFECSAAAGAVTCTVGSMDRFSVQVMVVVVNVPATVPVGTVLKDTATSSAFNPDPRPADNVATATTLVVNRRY
jgi:uncharacterized repeat protein (TIGR01451 family)